MNSKIIVVDLDGCLTDGTLTIDHEGNKLFKKFHTRDVRAIRELVFNGYEVYIVSADDWNGGKHFASKVGAIFKCIKDKSMVYEKVTGYRDYVCIGDDAWDVPMLKKAFTRYCPGDADPIVKKLPEMNILSTAGGCGIMAELVPILIP